MNVCHLVHLNTRQEIKTRSVAEFCRLSGLTSKNDRIHIYPILRGERLHHKGWALPEMTDKRLVLKDIYGNVYAGTLWELITRYRVLPCALFNLMTGKKQVLNGLMLESTNLPTLRANPIKIKQYQFWTPGNRVVVGNTMKSVARQVKNVSPRSLFELKFGRRFKSKGYRLKHIETERRYVLKTLY